MIECAKAVVGRVIGKGGETIKTLQKQYGVSIQIDQTTAPCKVSIAGPPQSAAACERAIIDIIEDRPHSMGMGGPGGYPGEMRGTGGMQVYMQRPACDCASLPVGSEHLPPVLH